MRLIFRWLLSAAALMLLACFLPGISVANWYNALIVALVLGLFNAILRPFLLLLTLPINILSLGLFTLIINTLLFWFVSTIVKGFEITGFWPAFWGAFVMWLVSWIVNELLAE